MPMFIDLFMNLVLLLQDGFNRVLEDTFAFHKVIRQISDLEENYTCT